MNDEDRDLRDAFTRLREDESGTVPPFRVPTPRRRAMRLALVLATLLLLVSIGYLVIPSRKDGEESGRWLASARPDPSPSARLGMTNALSTWRAPTDFLLRTPGRELLTTTPQLKPKIPGGRA